MSYVLPESVIEAQRQHAENVAQRRKVRSDQQAEILAALRRHNKTSDDKVSEYIVTTSLSQLTDAGINTVVTGLSRNDDLAEELFPRIQLVTGGNWIPQISAIYHLGLYPECEQNGRFAAILGALHAVNKIMKGPALSLDEWRLMTLEEPWKTALERVLLAWCTIDLSERLDAPLTPEVMRLLTDQSRGDYEVILSVIRKNPTATVEQIEHVLEGGSSSMSEGAL